MSAYSQAPSQGVRHSPALDSTRSRQPSEGTQHSPSPIIFAAPASQPGQPQPQHLVVVNVSHTPSPVPEITVDAADGGEKDMDAVHQVRLGELHADLGSDEAGSLHWGGESDRGSIAKEDFAYASDRTVEEETGEYVFPPYPRIRRVASGRECLPYAAVLRTDRVLRLTCVCLYATVPPWLDEPPDPDPAILRTVVFQLFLASTQILAAITSLVDIFSKHHTPSPLGTQHVAQLLVAWGPCLFVCMILLLRYLSSGPRI